MEEIARELFPGVRLTTIRTDRFPRACFSVHLLRPLRAADASRNALLMPVLRRGTRTLPDKVRIDAALAGLGGASLEPVLGQMGDTLSIGFRASFPENGETSPGADPLTGIIGLCGEMLLDPATRGGLLREDYVREEGQALHDRIGRAYSDPRNRAVLRARQRMFAGEPYGVCPLGEAAEALRVRYQPLTKFYREVLRTSPVELFYCGSAAYGRVEEAVRRAFMTLPGGGSRLLPEPEMPKSGGELRRVTEETDAEGETLTLGFRCRRSGPADDPALAVFHALFGGGEESRLRRNVQGKLQGCDWADSCVDRFQGVMLVSAGIGAGSGEEAEKDILAELRELAGGRIAAEELDAARKNVAAAYLRALDEPTALCDFRLEQNLLGYGGDLQQYAALAAEVSPEDVMRIAANMSPELVCLLRGRTEDRVSEAFAEI